MLKAIVNYSKKIPAETDYSSQGYSLSLETEITPGDPASIQAQIHDAFALVKASVDQELATVGTRTRDDVTRVTHDANHNRVETPVQKADSRPYSKREGSESGRNDRKATNKQISYINALVGNNGIPLSELMGDIQRRFNAPALYDLTAKQASTLIDELNQASRSQRAA